MILRRPIDWVIATLCTAIVVSLGAAVAIHPHSDAVAAPSTATAVSTKPALAALDTVIAGKVQFLASESHRTVPAHSHVILTGWAIPPDLGPKAVGVEASVDGGPWYAGQYGQPRVDVAKTMRRPDARAAGYAIPIETGAPGTHVVAFRLMLANGGSNPFPLRLVLHVAR